LYFHKINVYFVNIILVTVPPISIKKMVKVAGFEPTIFQFYVWFTQLFYALQIYNNKILNMQSFKSCTIFSIKF